MGDFNENSLTAAVQARLGDTPDPRLKRIMEALVVHLHGFVREIEPTFEEWLKAIQFLTRTGHACSDTRQEFILLSDTLGVTMLIDAINHRLPAGATETTVLGPFFVPNAPVFQQDADISGNAQGEPLLVEIEVQGADGKALSDAVVDVWQSDSAGFYDVQYPNQDGASLRGKVHPDADGRLRFWSIMPTAYPVPTDGPVGEMLQATGRHAWRPAHIHFMIGAPGHDTLVTHIFVEGDRYLDSDSVFGVKESLIHAFPSEAVSVQEPGRPGLQHWRSLRYVFRLAKNVAQAGG